MNEPHDGSVYVGGVVYHRDPDATDGHRWRRDGTPGRFTWSTITSAGTPAPVIPVPSVTAEQTTEYAIFMPDEPNHYPQPSQRHAARTLADWLTAGVEGADRARIVKRDHWTYTTTWTPDPDYPTGPGQQPCGS